MAHMEQRMDALTKLVSSLVGACTKPSAVKVEDLALPREAEQSSATTPQPGSKERAAAEDVEKAAGREEKQRKATHVQVLPEGGRREAQIASAAHTEGGQATCSPVQRPGGGRAKVARDAEQGVQVQEGSRPTEKQIADFKRVFQICGDGNGFITTKMAADVLGAIGLGMTEREVQVQSTRTNADGQWMIDLQGFLFLMGAY